MFIADGWVDQLEMTVGSGTGRGKQEKSWSNQGGWKKCMALSTAAAAGNKAHPS